MLLLSCRPSKDPRFDQTIGGKSFSNEAYSRRYAFLYDEVLPQERAALKQQLKVRRHVKAGVIAAGVRAGLIIAGSGSYFC